MRILYITDNDIKGHGGGCLGSRKYYSAIRAYAKQHQDVFKVISLGQNVDESFPISVIKNRKLDKLSRICGHSTYMYFTWKENKSKIINFRPDILFLGRTRLGFIAKELKKEFPKMKVVSFVDNVEYDYVDSYFSRVSGLKGKIFKSIEKQVVKRDESDTVKNSDKLVYLTIRDANRFQRLYHYKEVDLVVLPICLEKLIDLKLKSNKKTVVFIGSLNYGSNLDAVEELIKQVWVPNFSDNKAIDLVIAGGNPARLVYEWGKLAENIRIVPNFDKLEDFLPKHSLMVAPIPTGAGMKVKVAETLSMGLPIVASDEALVGYEDALRNDNLHCIIRANLPNEYVAAIKRFLSLPEYDMMKIELQNKKIFGDFYSFKIANDCISKIMTTFNKESS
ncbi:glycosyltransferase [uncultured Dialister sp.]|uniref:glycosyltransferase n=1 Tax=uncultured Dialister sp. TaxID=278064 RepID=UPI0026704514|nr:glycosyltransferase [uncultured Dialister sp.]